MQIFDVIIFSELCTIQQNTVKPTYLCPLGARKLAEGKRTKISWFNCFHETERQISVHSRIHALSVFLSSKLSHLVKEQSPLQAQPKGTHCHMDLNRPQKKTCCIMTCEMN